MFRRHGRGLTTPPAPTALDPGRGRIGIGYGSRSDRDQSHHPAARERRGFETGSGRGGCDGHPQLLVALTA
jgi:hypothetical protein